MGWERRLSPAYGLSTHWLKARPGPGGSTNPQHPPTPNPEQGCTEQRLARQWEQPWAVLSAPGTSLPLASSAALAQALGTLSPGTLQQGCAGEATALVAPRGNRAPVPSPLGRQMASEGLALANVLCPAVGAGKPHTQPQPCRRKLSLCWRCLPPASTGDCAVLGSFGLCFELGMDLGGKNMTFPPTLDAAILPPTHHFHQPGLEPSQHLC